MGTLVVFDGLGGLESSTLDRLQLLWARPENAVFFQMVCTELDAVERHLALHPDHPLRPPNGQDLTRWMTGRGLGDLVARGTIASGMLIHVYQACLLQPRPGTDTQTPPVGAIGHSLGVLGSVLAATTSRKNDAYLKLAAVTLRLLAITLVRCHEAELPPGPDVELVARYRHAVRRGPAPGPMAAISGMRRGELVDHLRGTAPSVVIGLTNTPTSHVLSGAPVDLLTVFTSLQSKLRRTGWSFLPSAVPFHSPLMSPTISVIQESRRFIGDLLPPSNLAFPVYAADRPRDLRDSGDLINEFLDLSLSRPVDWPATLAEVLCRSSIDHVLDYGPGAGARRFTKECLRDSPAPVRFGSARPDPSP